MKNFQQIAHSMDVLPLLLAIKRRPELWKADTYLRGFPQGPFGEVESIMLRFQLHKVCADEAELAAYLDTVDQHESVDHPAYAVLPEARSLVMGLMARVDGERLGRVVINKIRPGGRIYPHCDGEAHADYYSRFHLVLQSQPGVSFRAGDESVFMQTGSIWWFDNSAEHEVINNSADDRIHLIIDIRASK